MRIPADTSAVLVEDDATLRQHCLRWSRLDALALDTEFLRRRTFYPRLGLLQVSEGERCYLLDPLRIKDFSCFLELMRAPSITKVFHGCSEDLEVLRYSFGVLPWPLFDTQIAHALLEDSISISYQELVSQQLGMELDKSKEQTMSDWLARPLTEEQMRYAALDVVGLLALYERQSHLLAEHSRTTWLEEELRQLATRPVYSFCDQMAGRYGWSRRGQQQAAILHNLCMVREREARLRDLPRNWLMDNILLRRLAHECPREEAELVAIARKFGGGSKPGQFMRSAAKKFLRRESKNLLQMVVKGKQVQVRKISWRSLALEKRTALQDALRQQVRQKAQSLGIAAPTLVSDVDYRVLLDHVLSKEEVPLPRHLGGWRRKVVVDLLLETAQAQLASGP